MLNVAKTWDDVSRGSTPIKHGQVVGFCGFSRGIRTRNDIRNLLEYPICLTETLCMIDTDLRNPTSQDIFCENWVHNVAQFYCLILIVTSGGLCPSLDTNASVNNQADWVRVSIPVVALDSIWIILESLNLPHSLNKLETKGDLVTRPTLLMSC